MTATYLGVADCTRVDILTHYGADFAAFAPHLDLRRPEDITDPAAVQFLICFAPDPAVFARYPNLRAVCCPAAGTDGILACPTLPPDLPVIRVEDPDQALQMAGFAAFHVVWHHRSMGRYLAQQKRHEWSRMIGGRSPSDCAVGVLGFGHMGRAIAKALSDLGFRVATLSRNLPHNPLPNVTHFTDADRSAFLARTQIAINVLPLTPQTTGLIGSSFLASLPRGAALIHLGRGAQLDETALLKALNTGHLSGASLDVFATEPLPSTSPLWDHPKIFITPHTASQPESRAVVASVVSGLAAQGIA
ncbi:glyoxylate/hydroxypyruvate reductase A [Thioclava sp. SK-1]|uniref:2-hydroxyacid dehydrogenase n=1 Tax=Thioclava sp. SK-1 TaxID=1889770 RepID=UPI0008260C71|nr:glyoxylate/hydroxypyruvate reductase A [Thioclava sp. SK-1]OCX64608.1 glyoxylate/hydroxypyruvate reductase A [Thioclava sp. SK-1]